MNTEYEGIWGSLGYCSRGDYHLGPCVQSVTKAVQLTVKATGSW